MERKRSDKLIFLSLLPLCLLSLMFFSIGCGKPRGELFLPLDSSLVWPAPPDVPRIRLVGVLSTETDLQKEVSWTEGLVELIFGKKDTGVLVGPYASVIDENEKMFVADAASGLIQIFDMVSRDYKQFSTISQEERLLMPVSLALVDEYLYVVDSALHKVCVFGKDGEFLFCFGENNLKRPSGIAYWQGNEKIYVSDAETHVINVFSKEGVFETMIGSRGVDSGQFNFPTHLWIDKSGQLYVSDTLNYRIQILTFDGKFVRMFGRHGDRPGYFAHPCGVASDKQGNIYVIDRQFENFQIFDQQGQVLMSIGQEGSGLGEFWLPGGIFIDDRNRIYVADSFNKRIQIFELMVEPVQ
jgi:DNA-binding beta-propeller fold protein YncE